MIQANIREKKILSGSVGDEVNDISVGRGQMNIVIVGHVDHGKSTVIGRLLADTGSLPEGKLDAVKDLCARSAKPFEYAFLLDALKDERSQGITIDSARCFFKTGRRDYIVIDAPGHVEFLKNMVSGAARAEAAVLVICASEGIRENSRRHGYLVSMLGIRQVVVLINKMDLAGFDKKVYDGIVAEFGEFLSGLGVAPVSFIPASARDGENIAAGSAQMPWYGGPTLLDQLDLLEQRKGKEELPFRFPVQDIYKFTANNDDRRILAGTIESGRVRAGDEVIFHPSGKRSRVKSIEAFNVPPRDTAIAGQAVGLTLDTQVYVKPGEIMARFEEALPRVDTRFRANIFWMGRAPLVKGKTYKMKLATARVNVTIAEIISVMDASDLAISEGKGQIDRHDVGEVILESARPVAFDGVTAIEGTSRFVLVDAYEIAGGGIVIEKSAAGESLIERHIREREIAWDRGLVLTDDRRGRYRHGAKFIVLTGEDFEIVTDRARELERRLFTEGYHTYYLGYNNLLSGIGVDLPDGAQESGDSVRRLGELARILTDSGQIFITALAGIDDYDLELLKLLNEPSDIIVITVDGPLFSRYKSDIDIPRDATGDAVYGMIRGLLRDRDVIMDYNI